MSTRARRAGRGAGVVGAALAVQYLPSTVTLGQWASLQALPGGLCRWQGPAGRGQVALTFDDGPSPEATPAVLDRLDELGLRATFFPLASMAEREPDLLGEVVRRGHQVGVHGYDHFHHLTATPVRIWADLVRADRVLQSLGVRPTWYRPSYGQATGTTLVAARARRWRTVLWSAWGREWTTRDPHEVAARIARRLRPGAVVLLHDHDAFGAEGMWRVGLGALEEVAAELERRRLSAVTLDELVA